MPAADSNGAPKAELFADTSVMAPAAAFEDAFALSTSQTESGHSPLVRNFPVEISHAIRRHWLPAVVVGLIVGSLATVAAWMGIRSQYMATAVLRVSMDKLNLLELNKNADGANSGFDIYKRTQRQLVRSPLVLGAALQRKSISGLPLVTQQTDPLGWLQKIVTVTYPDEAEIMQINVRCEDRHVAETLADTVVDVYLKDVVYKEREEKLSRIESLKKAESETEASLRKKRGDLRLLADTLGTSDSEALTLVQKNTLQEYSFFGTRLNEVEFDLKRAQHARKMRNAAMAAATDSDDSVTDAELEYAAGTDSVTTAAKARIERLQIDIEKTQKNMEGPNGDQVVAGYQTAIDRERKKIETRKQALRKELAFRKQSLNQMSAAHSQSTSMEMLESQRVELSKKVNELRVEAEKFGRSSVDVELMRADIKALDDLRDRIQREVQQSNIEIASLKSRVVKLSDAMTPQNEDRDRRVVMSAGSGAVGFFVGCALVVLWDLRRQRLNTTREIVESMRLPILGTVPRVARLLDTNRLSEGLEEAIDGIVARLVFSRADDSPQVILITSAMAGEGKTTVAANLASSFAAMGRKTVLVDFDLRRPSLHNLFDVDLIPGISGVLTGQAETLDAVQPTSIDNLFLIPGGTWGQRGLSGRDDECIKRIVNELRASFVNIIIDAGPVLPVVDTRIVARHADGVIVSLLRDLSEIAKVTATCELLRSFEVRILGAVMIGVPGEVYYARTAAKVLES